MKKLISLGIISTLALSMLAGCSNQAQEDGRSGGRPVQPAAGQKPVISFEGVVSAVGDGEVTLEDGTVVRITEDTVFGGPDAGNAVSRDIQVGSFLQGYTEDGPGGEVTAGNIWTNLPGSGGGKQCVNFEGRVAAVEDGSITLDSGKTVRVGEQTSVKGFDGSAAEIAVGGYIQGYAADPDADELEAVTILVTIL